MEGKAMKKYIEMETAKSIILDLAFGACSPFDRVQAIDNFKSIPPADVEEVRHARWVWGNGKRAPNCSYCGEQTYWADEWGYVTENYCPNCGAKMDGKEKNK
jgi:NADH pyrophosphatase NudC (nudix superfamily)